MKELSPSPSASTPAPSLSPPPNVAHSPTPPDTVPKTVPDTVSAKAFYDDDCKDGIDTVEEEEDLFDYDSKLTLHSDIEIAKLLNKSGYKRVCKLDCTDQGSVWRARSPETQSVVIKMASKLYYTNNSIEVQMENILNEIALIQSINEKQEESDSSVVRQSIIKVLDTIDTDKHHMMVVEDGGIDLLCFVKQCHEQICNGTMTICEWQKSVRLISQRLIEVIHWLHTEVGICHLDISLENVLISNVHWISYPDQYKEWKQKLAPNFELKLIDFGAAQQFDIENVDQIDGLNAAFECQSVFGKLTYCSPQIFALQKKRSDKPYDARKADIWSFGVCLFTMYVVTRILSLSVYVPFDRSLWLCVHSFCDWIWYFHCFQGHWMSAMGPTGRSRW